MSVDPRVLRLLIERAERARDEAARLSGMAVTERQRAEATERMLQDYRRDLGQRSPVQAGRSLELPMLAHHDAFAQRLDRAIGEQGAQVRTLAGHAETARLDLVARQRRLEAMKALAARDAALAQAREQRRDQLHTDEHAGRKAARDAMARDARRRKSA